jgi:pyocin large subunit-like protein
MAGFKIWFSAGAALLLLAACERPSAVASKSSDNPSTSSSSASDSGRDASARVSADRRDEAVPEVDGKPMWSSSRKGTAQENAAKSFERNGEAFGADNLDAFVKKAHAFVDHPPAGTQTLKRSNGDTLFYDPKGNIFAVANKDGAPRTMFKPDEGAAYWDEQKAREAKRKTASSDHGGRNSDDG